MGDIRYTSGVEQYGTFSTLDDAFRYVWHEVRPSRAVVFWVADGDGKRVIGVRPIGGEPREVTFGFDAFSWWSSVPEPLKSLIADDPTRTFRAGELAGLEDVPHRPSPSVVVSEAHPSDWREPPGDVAARIDTGVAAFIDAITGRVEEQ